jgi:hypothetical protein
MDAAIPGYLGELDETNGPNWRDFVEPDDLPHRIFRAADLGRMVGPSQLRDIAGRLRQAGDKVMAHRRIAIDALSGGGRRLNLDDRAAMRQRITQICLGHVHECFEQELRVRLTRRQESKITEGLQRAFRAALSLDREIRAHRAAQSAEVWRRVGEAKAAGNPMPRWILQMWYASNVLAASALGGPDPSSQVAVFEAAEIAESHMRLAEVLTEAAAAIDMLNGPADGQCLACGEESSVGAIRCRACGAVHCAKCLWGWRRVHGAPISVCWQCGSQLPV